MPGLLKQKSTEFKLVVKGLIVDKVSMVGANILLEIHKHLQEIKGVSSDNMFGGVSILAVGDLYQLLPVGQPAVFDVMSDKYARLYASGSLWKEEFKIVELTEVMRQKGSIQVLWSF